MTVLAIQQRLKALGIYRGALDGKSGPLTKAAILTFQDHYGLVPDGIVGPMTTAALTQASTPVSSIAKPEPNKDAINAPTPSSATPPPKKPVIPSTARAINEVIIHCTATPEGKDYTVADVRAWHKARGWSDIGYHFVVYRDGRIMAGRPIGQIGAHVEGHNTGTVGVSYIGGLTADGKTAKDTRTAAQRASLLWLVAELKKRFPSIRKVTGHNQYAAKACPSFDVRKDPLGSLA